VRREPPSTILLGTGPVSKSTKNSSGRDSSLTSHQDYQIRSTWRRHVCSTGEFQTSNCTAYSEGIVHLDSEISDRALDLVVEQELSSSKIAMAILWRKQLGIATSKMFASRLALIRCNVLFVVAIFLYVPV
jgi:hypothetical protein